jgi:prevent-host-death family protein
MALIGVRELREQASEVIRRVREEYAEYVVTYQGQPVAIILPLDAGRAEAEMVTASKRAIAGKWAQYERLAQEISLAWPADLSTQDLLDSIRR